MPFASDGGILCFAGMSNYDRARGTRGNDFALDRGDRTRRTRAHRLVASGSSRVLACIGPDPRVSGDSAWATCGERRVLHDLPMLHVDGVLFEKVFMESHGRRIWTESRPEVGAAF